SSANAATGHSPGAGGGDGDDQGDGGKLLTTYTSGRPNVSDANEFNIQVNFSGDWTMKQQAVVKWAADFWSHVIAADFRDDIDLNGKPVDDIVINMSTGPIDGAGDPATGVNILAQTGIVAVRDFGSVDQFLPVAASIQLDSSDLKNPDLAGLWDVIVLHEMAHALGFAAPIFAALGMVGIDQANNLYVVGANAMNAYGGPVPLDDTASHWNEQTFQPNGAREPLSNELMTPLFVPGEKTILSDTTVGALADLGYHV